MKKDWELLTRQCRECSNPMATTSTKQVVHPECRKAYYSKKRRNPEGLAKLRFAQNRSKWFINEQPCVSCAASGVTYSLMTREKKFLETKYHLCPRCIAELRCGFIEELTWKPIGRSEPSTLSSST